MDKEVIDSGYGCSSSPLRRFSPNGQDWPAATSGMMTLTLNRQDFAKLAGLWLIWSSPESTPPVLSAGSHDLLDRVSPVGFVASRLSRDQHAPPCHQQRSDWPPAGSSASPGSVVDCAVFCCSPAAMWNLWPGSPNGRTYFPGCSISSQQHHCSSVWGVLRTEGKLNRGQVSPESSQALFWKKWILALVLFWQHCSAKR